MRLNLTSLTSLFLRCGGRFVGDRKEEKQQKEKAVWQSNLMSNKCLLISERVNSILIISFSGLSGSTAMLSFHGDRHLKTPRLAA